MPPRTEKNEQFSRPGFSGHHVRHLGRVASSETYHNREPVIPEHVKAELTRLDELITRDPRRAQGPAAAQFLDIYYPIQLERTNHRYPNGTRPIDAIAQVNAYAHVFARLFEGMPTDRLRDDLLNKMRAEIENEALLRGMHERRLESIDHVYADMMRGVTKEVESLHTLQAKGIAARSSTPHEDLNGYDIVASVGKREFYLDIKGTTGFDKLLESGHATPVDGLPGVAMKRSSDRSKQVIVVNAVERGYDGAANHHFAFTNPQSFLAAAVLGMQASAGISTKHA